MRTFVFTQESPDTSWAITHNLDAYPRVLVLDPASNTIEGDIAYNSPSQLTLTFSSAISGTAYLN